MALLAADEACFFIAFICSSFNKPFVRDFVIFFRNMVAMLFFLSIRLVWMVSRKTGVKPFLLLGGKVVNKLLYIIIS